MPGVHTFYDGSKVLEPLATAIGFETDKLNFVFCMLLGLPLSYVYNTTIRKTASREVRIIVPLLVGVFFLYFCFGNATKHLFAMILVSYGLLRFAPPTAVQWMVFLWAMGYLTFIHVFRWLILDTYSIDITGPMMVIVQKVTTLAFNLYDGKTKRPEEMSKSQAAEAIKEPPPFLDFLSYTLFFQSVLCGPTCQFSDYRDFIDGTDAGAGSSAWPAIRSKLAQSLFFVAAIIAFSSILPVDLPIRKDVLAYSYLAWLPLTFIVIALQRVNYYFAWTLADAVCNVSGLGARRDEKGKVVWDMMTNVYPVKVEMAQSFKETLDAWNCTTMGWLRRVVYTRVPPAYRTLATYLLSSAWHGVFPGYYTTFLTGALFTVAGQTWRRSMRWRFLHSAAAKRAYDVFTFVFAKLVLAYCTFPFVNMQLAPGIRFYTHIFFVGHLAALFVVFGLPKLVGRPPKSDKVEHPDVAENNNTTTTTTTTRTTSSPGKANGHVKSG